MLRRLILAALALSLPLATLGAAPPPPGVNLNNGYMIIHNRITDAGQNVTSLTLDSTKGWHWIGRLGSGQTHVFNACCLHEGPYWLTCATGLPGNCHGEYIRPRLCTLSGVSFRYAEVEIRGAIGYHNGNRAYYWEALPSFHQIDTSCPSA